MDTLTPEQRSERMSRVRSRDTRPELRVRGLAYRLGYRYRLRAKDIPGHPDLVFRSRRTVIFVHGCFWNRHLGCPRTRTPKTRQEFWEAKFARNVGRDREVRRLLEDRGWQALTVWECETEKPEELAPRLIEFLGEKRAIS